jgi:DNA-binding CsgD family transcriptional regulator
MHVDDHGDRSSKVSLQLVAAGDSDRPHPVPTRWRRANRSQGEDRDQQRGALDAESTRDLSRAGRLALQRCAEDLDGLPVGVVLCTPPRGPGDALDGVTVIESIAGTATHRRALDRCGLVPGSEWESDADSTGRPVRPTHKAEPSGPWELHVEETRLVCALAPILETRRNRPVGMVSATAETPDASPFLKPLARLVARAIAQYMADDSTIVHQTLLEGFERARRRSRAALIAVSEREMLTNAAASRLVNDEDGPQLWKWTTGRLGSGEHSAPDEMRLRGNSYSVRCEPIALSGRIIGGLLELRDETSSSVAALDRPQLGWESLIPSELGVARLVAQGLTNREIAARLFVSPHTIGFRLRQIFRKLSIGSRVELARLAVEHAELDDLPRRSSEVVALKCAACSC